MPRTNQKENSLEQFNWKSFLNVSFLNHFLSSVGGFLFIKPISINSTLPAGKLSMPVNEFVANIQKVCGDSEWTQVGRDLKRVSGPLGGMTILVVNSPVTKYKQYGDSNISFPKQRNSTVIMSLVQELRSWVWFSGYEFCSTGQDSQKVKPMTGQQSIAIGKALTALPARWQQKSTVGEPRLSKDTMQQAGDGVECGCFSQSMKFTWGSLAPSAAWSKTHWPQ